MARFTARRNASDPPAAGDEAQSTMEGVSWTVFPEPEPVKDKPLAAEPSNPLLSD